MANERHLMDVEDPPLWPTRGLSADNLERRKGFVCGSDAGRIINGDWPALWREKTGRAKPENLSGIFEVQLGLVTERFNLDWLERTTGRAVSRRGAWCESAIYPWMACNLDGETTTPQGFRAAVDAKHVGRSDDVTTMRYTAQLTHNATVIGTDWWVLSVIQGNKWQEPIIQEVDPLFQAELLDAEERFWAYVREDREPPDMRPVNPPKPQPRLRAVRLEDTSENWAPEMVKLIGVFADTKAASDKHAIVRKEIAALRPEDVGQITFGLFKLGVDKAGTVRMSLSKVQENG